jgi:hypothetical protein
MTGRRYVILDSQVPVDYVFWTSGVTCRRIEGLGGRLAKGGGPHGVEVGVVAGEPLALRKPTSVHCNQN